MIREEDNTEAYKKEKTCSELQKQFPDAYIFPSTCSTNFLAANKSGIFFLKNKPLGFKDGHETIINIDLQEGSHDLDYPVSTITYLKDHKKYLVYTKGILFFVDPPHYSQKKGTEKAEGRPRIKKVGKADHFSDLKNPDSKVSVKVFNGIIYIICEC